MSYYMFEPGQILSGCGATSSGGGIDFNGAQVWADWVACDKAYRAAVAAGKSFSGDPSCNNAVDSMRAALGQLGYGGLGMGVSWGSADQAAYKQWAADAGVPSNNGLPTETGLQVMETQIKAGVTPGPQEPISYTKVADTYVESSKVGVQTAGMGLSTWGLLALAGAGVVAVAVVAGKKKKEQKGGRARPGLAGPPSAAAAR